MKKFRSGSKLMLLFVLLLITSILVFAVLYNRTINKPLKSNDSTIMIEVRQGEGFYDILNRLDKEGKLFNKLLLKVKLSIDKKEIKLIEGVYEIDTNSNLDNLIKSLESTADNKELIKLTIPEGYTIEDIASEVEKQGFCSKDEFLEKVKNYPVPSFVKVSEKKKYNLEGYLYPDTYLIKKGSDGEYIINMMIMRFNQVINQAKDETGVDLDSQDIEKIINIASMIESEARFDNDRPLISSVIYNRLEKNMKLQLDATVIYSLGYHVDVVLNRHLAIDSAYNTYKYEGLPIGPISNPGIKSIKAALLPKKTDYIYYVLKKDGTHYFTNNYDDFLTKKKELGY